MGKNKLLILGAGSYAEEIAEMASSNLDWQVEGFVEGIDHDRCNLTLQGKRIFWIDEIRPFSTSCKVICAVGSTERCHFINQAKVLGFHFANLISPAAHIPPSVSIGEGVIVGPGVMIGSYSILGNHTILTRGCLIGHHVKIGDFCTLATGVNIGGKTTIAERCFIGLGANIFDNISIGAGSMVGAGSLVTHQVPAGVVVIGVPAQVVKSNSVSKQF